MNAGSSLVNRHSRGGMVPALIVLWLAVAPSASSAAIYIADANHPSARDTNPGTEALPFKTIGRATSLVKAGDTVFVPQKLDHNAWMRLTRDIVDIMFKTAVVIATITILF